MKKLVFVAAVLLIFPAVASAQLILQTDFESASLGLVVPQNIGGHSWGGSGQDDVYVIDVGGSHGQVMAWQPAAAGTYRVFVDRTDVPTPVTYPDGVSIWQYDVLMVTDNGDLTSSTNNEWGPISTHWFDPAEDDLDMYNGGPQWEWPDLTNLTVAETPVTLDDWVTIRCEYNHTTGLVDYYLDNVLVGGGLASEWFEVNYIQWELTTADPLFGQEGDYYMLVDNVLWTHVPEPSVLLLGAFGLLALLRRRK